VKIWSELNTSDKLMILTRLALDHDQKEIAEILGCTPATLYSFGLKYDLKIWRQGARLGNKNAMIDGLSKQTIRRLTRKVIIESGRNLYHCERCSRTDAFGLELHRHHIDRDRTNNTSENLEILCASCHTIEHQKDKTRDVEGRFNG